MATDQPNFKRYSPDKIKDDEERINKLRTLCREHGSQVKWAKICGVAHTTIGKMLIGEVRVNDKALGVL